MGSGTRTRSLDPVADPERCPQDERHVPDDDRKADPDEPPEQPGIRSITRDDANCQPSVTSQPGQRVDPGISDQGHRQQRRATQDPLANSSRPRTARPGPPIHPKQPDHQEDADVGHRDQPRRSGGSPRRDDSGRTSLADARSCPPRAGPRPARTMPTRGGAT